MRCLAFCVLFLLFYGNVFCQMERERDSLETLLRNTKLDSERAQYLAQLGDLYVSVNPPQAIPYYERAFHISFKPFDAEQALRANLAATLSSMYQSNGDSASAAKWIDSAIIMLPGVKDVDIAVRVYAIIGDYYSMTEQYEKAIACSQQIIHIADSLKQPTRAGMAYVNMGNMYFKMGQQARSIYYYRRALVYVDTIKYPQSDFQLRANIIGSTSVGLGQVYFELKQYDSALYYADRGYKVALAVEDLDGQCTQLEAKAFALQKLNRYTESLVSARTALKLAKENNIFYQLTGAYSGLAMGYAHTGQKDSALMYAKLCNEQAIKTINNKEDWVDIYATWSNVYEGLGDYKQAWQFKQKELDAYKEYRDNEVNKAINRSEILFETKRKEQEIVNLNTLAKQQRTIQWIIAAGLLVTFAAAIGFWLSYRNKRKAAAILEQSNKEKEIFLKEIHHRVKNNLQIISSLLYLQFKDYKDEKMIAALQQAQQRIKSMALVHNKLYEKQDVVHVYLKEYINDLAAGILASNNPEGKQINVSVEEKGNLAFSLDTSISIGLILNEVITNSCKYAFDGKPGGNINISLEQTGGRYKLQVADDGNGLPGNFEKKNSLGVRLVKNLARQMGGEASFSSVNGTAVTILFTENAAA